jgi:2-methylcitrate dehydratase PrpD
LIKGPKSERRFGVGTTRDIAEFAHKTTFDEFDPALVKHVKDVLLSGVGMTMAGVSAPSGKVVLNYIKECAAAQEAGVLGAGFRTSAEYAALANGTTSHSTELEDDTFPEGIYSVGIFPGVLALGEKLHVSGKEVIEAFVVAWDIAAKLALPTIQMLAGRGMRPAFTTIGVAAASSAKLLKLDIEKTTMALSIVASHTHWGVLSQTGTGAHLYEAGLAGRNGIASAMLAKHGLTGQPDVLEMPRGYLHGVAGEAYPLPKLGEPYRVRDIGIKKYPCCYLEMHLIDGFIELIEANNISADDVESIQVDVVPVFLNYVRFQHPKDDEEARFSLPHSIACCFLDKRPWIESYTAERVNDPQVMAFRDRVRVVAHPEWATPELPWGGETPITIRLKDGTEYKKVCPKITDPIIVSDEEVTDKYMKCALRVLFRSRAEQVAEMVLSLEKVPDISELMTLCTFPDK